MSHTKEWKIREECQLTYFIELGNDKGVVTIFTDTPEKTEKAAHLIIAAPPMNMLLSLLASGEARIERSKTQDFVEFCWRGIRYPCSDCDWSELVKTIGYEKVQAAIAAAEKAEEKL